MHVGIFDLAGVSLGVLFDVPFVCVFLLSALFSTAALSCFVFQESLIDASEDSQLEAAIRASLQETHYESSHVPDAPDSPRSDDDSDAEPFSDSEGPISVDVSDNELPDPQEEKGSNSKQAAAPPAAAPHRFHPDSSSSCHRKSPFKENNHCHKKEESKKNHLEPSAGGVCHPQPDAECGGNSHTAPPESAGTLTTCSAKTHQDVDCPDDNGNCSP